MALSGSRVRLPAQPIVHRVFEEHARLHPDHLALTCGSETRTYDQLNARANQFAHYLASLGVARGSLVGVCLDRSPELMVTILGILKAGAAYVPLDPTYPQERLRLMISQLPQVELTVASPSTLDLVGRGTAIDTSGLAPMLNSRPGGNPQLEVSGDDLCYAVFTSGSTGSPKATAVRHVGWYNLLNWLKIEYSLTVRSANLMVSSFGFDISQRSLMTPLFTGAPLHLLPSRNFDVSLAYRLIGDLGVRTMHCAPSTLYMLVERELAAGGDALMALDYVFIGGEPLSARRVADWAMRDGNRCVLLHQYGVAECTDVASSHVMSAYRAYLNGPVPVGQPVYNTQIQLLGSDLTEVPDGEIGEICISGTSVGAGYLNGSPEDGEKFVTLERDGKAVPLYRTGDRGYVTSSAELAVVGRADAQVKIRGMRIDLGDVEYAVRSHRSVRDATVLALRGDDGETDLVAFIITADGPVKNRTLRRELLQSLPRNMVPQEFIELPAFPLNPNGKVDRMALARARQPWPPTGAVNNDDCLAWPSTVQQ
jgi:D-alanine--poly(phosphoribitol) ligase subunit 1